MEVLLKRDHDELPATWKFATLADVKLLQGWAKFLSKDSSVRMQDAADFARQAVDRRRGYAGKRLTISSLEEAGQNSPNSDEESAGLLVLKADWGPSNDSLAFAYFRRTWCGGFYLEFMAGHPLTEGQNIKGIVRAVLRALVSVAEKTGAEWIWWEATKDSFPRYEAVIKERNVLFSTEPRVKDVFVVRVADLRTLLK